MSTTQPQGRSRGPRLNSGHVKPLVKYSTLAVVGFLFFLVPLWLALVTSAKPLGEAIDLNLRLPEHWAMADNYSRVFVEGRVVRAFVNSVLVTGSAAVVLLALGSMAAWAFARTSSKALRIVYYVVIVGVLVPPALVPSLVLLRFLGIEGTHLALIIFTVAVRLPLVVFLMTGFVRGLPREFEDAAAVDGAGTIQTYYHVMLPMMRPILLTVLVILVIVVWNDAFIPFFILHGQERATLPLSLLGITEGGSHLQIPWNLLFTHLVLVSLPLMVVYFVVQRHVVGGLTQGAMKG